MSATAMDRICRPGRPVVGDWLERLRLPPETWSGQRRLLVALSIAAAVYWVGATGWISADPLGVAGSRVSLKEAQHRLAAAQHDTARLPALRRAAADSPANETMPSNVADDLRMVSQLASRNGIALLTLEPATAEGEGMDVMRPIRLTAHADFVPLTTFLRALPTLPTLVVPADLTVKRTGDKLAVSATLRVFNGLPAASAIQGADPGQTAGRLPDPFAPPAREEVSGDPSLRVVGLLRNDMRSVALLETPDGAIVAGRGQRIGAERVTRIDARGITLANGSATRVLALIEASP
jgi:Tfp pilus assembly protein PilO